MASEPKIRYHLLPLIGESTLVISATPYCIRGSLAGAPTEFPHALDALKTAHGQGLTSSDLFVFYIHPGEGGGTIPYFTTSRAGASRKSECVGRYETQRLAPNFKVLGQPVTSEVRSMTQKSGFCFWQITSQNMVATCRAKR